MPLLTVRQAEDLRIQTKRKVMDKDEGSSGSRGPSTASKKARLDVSTSAGLKTVKEKRKGRAFPKSLPYIDNDNDTKDPLLMHTVCDSSAASLSLPVSVRLESNLFPVAFPGPPSYMSPLAHDSVALPPLLPIPLPPVKHESPGPNATLDWDQLIRDISSQKLVGQPSQPTLLPWDDPSFGLLTSNNNGS